MTILSKPTTQLEFQPEKKGICISSILEYLQERFSTDRIIKIHFWAQYPEDAFGYVYSRCQRKTVYFCDTENHDLMKHDVWLKLVKLLDREGNTLREYYSLKYYTTSSSTPKHFIEFEKNTYDSIEDACKAVNDVAAGTSQPKKSPTFNIQPANIVRKIKFKLNEYFFSCPAIPVKDIDLKKVEEPETYYDLKLECMTLEEDSHLVSESAKSAFQYAKFSLRINQKTQDDFLDSFQGDCFGANSGIIEYLHRHHSQVQAYKKVLSCLREAKSIAFLEYPLVNQKNTLDHCLLYQTYERIRHERTLLYSLKDVPPAENCTSAPNRKYIILLEEEEQLDVELLTRVLKRDDVDKVQVPSQFSSQLTNLIQQKELREKLVWISCLLLNSSVFRVKFDDLLETVENSRNSVLQSAQMLYLFYFHQIRLHIDEAKLVAEVKDIVKSNIAELKDDNLEGMNSDKLLQHIRNRSPSQPIQLLENLRVYSCIERNRCQDYFALLQYLAFHVPQDELQYALCNELLEELASNPYVVMNPRRYLVEMQVSRLKEEFLDE